MQAAGHPGRVCGIGARRAHGLRILRPLNLKRTVKELLMRRRVALWYAQSDSEWAEAFRARWAKHLNVEQADGSPPEVIDPEGQMEAGHTTAPSDRARVVILLVGAGTAE